MRIQTKINLVKLFIFVVLINILVFTFKINIIGSRSELYNYSISALMIVVIFLTIYFLFIFFKFIKIVTSNEYLDTEKDNINYLKHVDLISLTEDKEKLIQNEYNKWISLVDENFPKPKGLFNNLRYISVLRARESLLFEPKNLKENNFPGSHFKVKSSEITPYDLILKYEQTYSYFCDYSVYKACGPVSYSALRNSM